MIWAYTSSQKTKRLRWSRGKNHLLICTHFWLLGSLLHPLPTEVATQLPLLVVRMLPAALSLLDCIKFVYVKYFRVPEDGLRIERHIQTVGITLLITLQCCCFSFAWENQVVILVDVIHICQGVCTKVFFLLSARAGNRFHCYKMPMADCHWDMKSV